MICPQPWGTRPPGRANGRIIPATARSSRLLDKWGALHWLSGVEVLKKDGLSIWWFDADHAQGRKAFIQRGDGSISAFEKQISDISRAWQKIKLLFALNIVTTLASDGKRILPVDLFRRLNEDSA
jgi:hypothetical protein